MNSTLVHLDAANDQRKAECVFWAHHLPGNGAGCPWERFDHHCNLMWHTHNQIPQPIRLLFQVVQKLLLICVSCERVERVQAMRLWLSWSTVLYSCFLVKV